MESNDVKHIILLTIVMSIITYGTVCLFDELATVKGNVEAMLR